MKYMGSKSRHAKDMIPIILKGRTEDQFYVEPFAGGMNMIDKVTGPRIANDKNEHVIDLFTELVSGFIPPDSISEEDYKNAKYLCKNSYCSLSSQEKALVSFIGFGCSYSGKWFGGYARGNDVNGNPRNYCLESKRNILKQAINLKGVEMISGDYFNFHIPKNSIIYCDPPYSGTTGYRDKFNSQSFWSWCDSMNDCGHTIYVSEYNAPDGWNCVFEKTVNNSLTKDTGIKTGVERLFTKEPPPKA